MHRNVVACDRNACLAHTASLRMHAHPTTFLPTFTASSEIAAAWYPHRTHFNDPHPYAPRTMRISKRGASGLA